MFITFEVFVQISNPDGSTFILNNVKVVVIKNPALQPGNNLLKIHVTS